MKAKTDIWVYAHWKGLNEPKCIGILSAQQAKGRKAFSFTYAQEWLQSEEQILIDPDIAWYRGSQYPDRKMNFGLFLDSMPDTWGRTLMKRRAAILAKEENKPAPALYDIDYLLGVHDISRMGALRFKTDPEGEFLDNNADSPTPPWATIRELQHAVEIIETGNTLSKNQKWLKMLMAPGSSLGGARPKANVLDEKGNLWIAKFPSQNDTVNKAAWEFLAYKLAIKAGIDMAECKLQKIAGRHHTFFTKRFDREKKVRIHFASAMTMTGNNEELIRDNPASYLDLVEFIQFSGCSVNEDLKQLWRRMIFNILISNTDDHLRNHGFILTPKGWRLSPAYDINPSTEKEGLSLNIDTNINSLDIDLAKSVGQYFRLNANEMNDIVNEVRKSVSKWQAVAKEIGITKNEQVMMGGAFRI
ncbi:MAG TPA: HipA domain-containing protein [Niabella sp.]|nr:HipA domain-containing protein [Niabella sp.]